MKTKSIAIMALLAFLPLAGFSQPPTPPTPPNPPVSPVPPIPPDKPEKMPKVPVTFLGVETSGVPSVVCDQLGIAKGFGLVVDYVVPDGPAAAAGVQQNDILKMLNDQILLEPGQLAKLVRSYSEGTTVTLTVLRKGQEQKIPVKLTKKEVPKRHASRMGHDMDFNFNYDLGDFDLGNLKERLEDLRENMKDQFGEHGDMVHDAVMTAQAQAQRIRDEAQRARDRAQRVRDEAQRARDEAHRVRDESHRAGEIKVTRTGDNGLMTTKIDIGKAQIVFSDDKGELRLERTDGKQILTAKDPKGMLLFSGPVETKEERDKIPTEVRARFEKLEQHDLPSVTMDENGDEDDSGAMDQSDDEDAASVEQVSVCPQSLPHNFWAYRTVLI
jgi:PDZ domain-containing protein